MLNNHFGVFKPQQAEFGCGQARDAPLSGCARQIARTLPDIWTFEACLCFENVMTGRLNQH